MQDKKPYNKQEQRHGLWEEYFSNGELWYKGYFINNVLFGYFESNVHNQKEYYAR